MSNKQFEGLQGLTKVRKKFKNFKKNLEVKQKMAARTKPDPTSLHLARTQRLCRIRYMARLLKILAKKHFIYLSKK